MSVAGREVFDRGSDGGGRGGGGWDMRVVYYLPGPGHDARSRIGSTTCVHFGGSFSNWERQGVVQCWTGRQECGHCLECGGVRGL
jgi:hypothetical protein